MTLKMYTNLHYPKVLSKNRKPIANKPFESFASSTTLVRCPSTISFSAKENKRYYPSPNRVAFPERGSVTHSMTKFKDDNITPMTRLKQKLEPGRGTKRI